MSGMKSTVEILKELDEHKRELYLKSLLFTAHPDAEMYEVVAAYPEIIEYAHSQGEEFFSEFVGKYVNSAVLLANDNVLEVMDKVSGIESLIINPNNVETYMLIPAIRDKLLETRKEDVMWALRHTWSVFLDDRVVKILIEGIENDENYVLGENEEELDAFLDDDKLIKVKLIRSLKNNREATFKYLKYPDASLRTIMDKEVVDTYINNNGDFVIDENSRRCANKQPYLLEVSMQNDREATMDFIQNNIIFLSDIPLEDMKKVLGKDFVIDGRSGYLLREWPGLLSLSLENDEQRTIEALSRMSFYGFTVNETYELSKQLVPYLKKSGFVVDKNTIGLAKINSDIIQISFENNPYDTLMTLVKEKYDKETREFLVSVDIEEVFSNHPDFVMNADVYADFKGLLSKDAISRLVKLSLRNDAFATLTAGEHIFEYLSVDDKDMIKRVMIENVDKLSPSFDTKHSLTQLINKNPQIIGELIRDNYGVGLNVLRCADVSKFTPEANAIIKEELTKKNYVVGYKDNNPYLVELMFIESLRNDFEKTVKHGINEIYKIKDFVEDRLKENHAEIQRLFVENISTKDIRFNATMREFVSQDNFILVKAMERDYERTLRNIARGDKTTQITINDTIAAAKIYQMLKDNNFVLTGEYKSLLLTNPIFLIASLENDYDATREFLMNDRLPMNDIDLSEEQIRRISLMCRDHNKDTELLLRLSSRMPSLMVKKMERGLEFVLDEVEKIERPNAIVDKRHSEAIMDKLIELSATKNIDLSKYPKFVSIISWGLFSGPKKQGYIDFLIEHKAPLTYIPFSTFEEISPYLESPEVKELYRKVYFNQTYEYSREDELKLLKCLNSKFDTIEDELAYLQSLSLSKKDLSLTQMLALAFFAKKDQHKKGIKNCKVDVFAYAPGKTNLGVFTGSQLRVYNGHDESIHAMVSTVLHENNHARQQMDVNMMDVSSDPDLIVYTKDQFIRTLLRNHAQFDYYNNNYWNISFEYDTELKAQMEAIKILRLEEEKILKGEDLPTLVDREALTRFGAEHNKYTLTADREFDGQTYELEDLFEYCLNVAVKTGVMDIDEILRQYPIINYEYDTSCVPVRKYELKELMDAYKAAMPLDKDVYQTVLRYRLNPIYNKNHFMDLSELVEYAYGDDELMKLLEDIVNDLNRECKASINGQTFKLGKYMDIASRIIEDDKRISREEFNNRKNS